MDEVALIYPHIQGTLAKDLIKLIFKQARKYGVARISNSKRIDVDYKILAQANTTFIGRFTQPQDVEKVRHLPKKVVATKTLSNNFQL